MQIPSAEGLSPTEGSLEQQRYDIVPIYGANSHLADSLIEIWARKKPSEAHDKLKDPDVTVTNEGDKKSQLKKLLKFNDQVKQACSASQGRGKAAGDEVTPLGQVEP